MKLCVPLCKLTVGYFVCDLYHRYKLILSNNDIVLLCYFATLAYDQG